MKLQNLKSLDFYLRQYLTQRPLFLSLIRAKEAFLFNRYCFIKQPVLDVGCGDGFFASIAFEAKLKKNHAIDVGLDVLGSRISEAKSLRVYKKLITYDGKEIPYANKYFQTVISNCVLEHIENLSLTLSEIHRVLAPRGMFYTTVMARAWEQHLFGTAFLGDWYKAWMRKKQVHRNLLSSQEWRETFKKAGFTVVKQVGYLSPSACRLIDICHYASLPSLFTYRIFGKWVLFPQLNSYFYPVGYLASTMGEASSPDQSGAIFYILRKC